MTKCLLMNGEQVARAAEELIAQHGDSAVAQADKQIRTSESEGFGHVAETWKLIRDVVRDTQESNTMTEGYRKALYKGVLLSE